MKIENVQKLTVKPGDVLVVQIPHTISEAQCKRIAQQVSEATGVDTKHILILGHDAQLSVLSKGKGRGNVKGR